MSSSRPPSGRGELWVVSAPSGTGKTTVVDRLMERATTLQRSRSYTSRAARAIGLGKRVGTISLGKYADLIAFKVSGNEPLKGALESDLSPSACWIGGKHVSHLAVGTLPEAS